MTEIVEAIDEYSATFFAAYNTKLYGFCELMKKSAGDGAVEQPIPVTIPARMQVAIDDRYEVLTWIRQTNIVQYEANEEWSFGKNEARFASLPLRIVLAHKVELGENVVFEFVQNFPSKLLVPNYNFIFINGSQSIDTDHEAIYLTELGKTTYEKHRFPWNLYAINLNVQFILCDDGGEFKITEDGAFKILE